MIQLVSSIHSRLLRELIAAKFCESHHVTLICSLQGNGFAQDEGFVFIPGDKEKNQIISYFLHGLSTVIEWSLDSAV